MAKILESAILTPVSDSSLNSEATNFKENYSDLIEIWDDCSDEAFEINYKK